MEFIFVKMVAVKDSHVLESSPDLFILPGLISGLYVFCSILSNIFSVKLVLIPFLNWAVDGGTIIYPISFVVRDMLHKSVGRKFADYTIISSGILTILMALLIKIVVMLPPDPSWQSNQVAFAQTLSYTWRIIFSSIIAQIIANLVNTRIFGFAFRKFPDKDIFVSLTSNGISLFLDTFLFCALAFSLTYPWHVIFQIIGSNLIFKMLTAFLLSPSIRFVQRKVNLDQI